MLLRVPADRRFRISAVAVADPVLDPYVNAPTLVEAEQELDRLAGREGELPVRLGDLYDELAELAAQDDEFELAARLEAKAVEAGCGQPMIAREMGAWYLLKAGATDEGEAAFRELCAERPDDAGVRITLGHAYADAGLQGKALDAFDEALAAAKRGGFQRDIDRARIERRAEREHVGLDHDPDDLLAPVPALPRSGPVACALAWFPPDQRQDAVELWPDLADDFEDPRAYARVLEGQLRDLDRALGCRPALAPIDVVELIAWAAAEGYEPGSGQARSIYAAQLHRSGRAIPWPPGRNDPCWCRSGQKYKRCCGSS